MPQRNVATNFTFEQQRVEINNLAQDFWTQKGTVDTAASTYLKHDGSNAFTGGTLAVPNAFTINSNSGNGTVTIAGNLQVDGTTTTVNTATMDVVDKNITIAKGSANDAAADGAGITIDSATDITFNFVDANDAWVSSIGLEATTFLKGPYGQFTGSGTPTTGQGVEVNAPDANTGQITSYDRGNSAYKELRVKGSSVGVYTGTTNALVGTFNSTGLTMESGKNIAAQTLTSTGDVSLGHASATARLDVRRGDADGLIAEFHQSTGYGIDIGSSTSDAYISSGYNQNFIFKTDAGSGQVERLKITSGGSLELTGGTGANVLINAATHNASTANQARVQLGYVHSGGQALAHLKLDENSNNSFDGIVKIGVPYNNGSGGSSTREVLEADFNGNICIPGSTVVWDTTARTNGLQLYYETDSGIATIGSYSGGGSTQLSFYTNASSGAATEKLRIHNDGQVTIGNDHAGGGSWDGDLVVANSTGGRISVGDTGSGERFDIAANGDINLYSYLNGDGINFHTTDGNGTLRKLLIDANGRVLIGAASSTSSAKLAVNGSITGPEAFFELNRTDDPSNNQNIGCVEFSQGSAASRHAARIVTRRDGGVWGAASLPTRFEFHTCISGTNSPTEKLRISSNGNVLPGSDNSQDLGSTTNRWANVYTGDMHLNNMNTGGNDVDGSEGHWTMQEGADDLFLINRNTGKKYKFNLTEVS